MIGTISLADGNWKVEKNMRAKLEVIVPPKKMINVKWNNSTFDFLLSTENKAKQKAPSKTRRLILIPEK